MSPCREKSMPFCWSGRNPSNTRFTGETSSCLATFYQRCLYDSNFSVSKIVGITGYYCTIVITVILLKTETWNRSLSHQNPASWGASCSAVGACGHNDQNGHAARLPSLVATSGCLGAVDVWWPDIWHTTYVDCNIKRMTQWLFIFRISEKTKFLLTQFHLPIPGGKKIAS